MKSSIAFTLAVLSATALSSYGAVTVQTFDEAGHLSAPYRYQVTKVSDKAETAKLPAVIFCHGTGGGNKSFPPEDRETQWRKALSQNGDSFYFFMPKNGEQKGSLSLEGLEAFIQHAIEHYAVDPDQITIAGYSAGSGAVTSMAVTKGHLIKGAMVIEGGFRGTVPTDHTLDGLPIWVFHNKDDHRVAFERGESFVNLARDAGAEVNFTVNPDGLHKIQIQRNITPEVVSWIFSAPEKD